jgi:hypothetical protein
MATKHQIGDQAACRHCGMRITLFAGDGLVGSIGPRWVDRNGLWHCTPEARYHRAIHRPE